jgi:hypothetical protein
MAKIGDHLGHLRRLCHGQGHLGLPLDDAGFDASVLCEFRARLIAGSAELLLLEALLTIGVGRIRSSKRAREAGN